MLALDAQLALTRSWQDAAFQWMNTWTGIMTEALSTTVKACEVPRQQDREPEQAPAVAASPSRTPSRSWYRHPDANPFAISLFGLSFGQGAGAWPGTPFDAFAALTQSMQFMNTVLGLTQSVLGQRAFGSPLSASFVPDWALWTQPRSWLSSPAALPKAALPPPVPAPFVAYRSDSGYSVTQFTFPNNVVAAIALPSATAATDSLEAWSSLWRH